MAKHLIKALVIAILVGFGVYFAQSLTPGKKPKTAQVTTTAASSDQETSADSPDAKLTLTMLEQKGKDSSAYLFFVSNKDGSSKKQVFEKTAGANQTFVIPHNSWSPDNKYLFIKEASPTRNSYFVLTASGNQISKDNQTMEVAELFEKKYPNYKIVDVTGWAAPTLLILNTINENQAQGPSFWFEVPSGAFVQLSSHF